MIGNRPTSRLVDALSGSLRRSEPRAGRGEADGVRPSASPSGPETCYGGGLARLWMVVADPVACHRLLHRLGFEPGPRVWVPIIRSWALTRGFALHPWTRNRYEIRYTRTQHRPPSGHFDSSERPAARDSSTNTNMPPDQPRHHFGHPQVRLSLRENGDRRHRPRGTMLPFGCGGLAVAIFDGVVVAPAFDGAVGAQSACVAPAGGHGVEGSCGCVGLS